ncbi:hypothetical protein H696_04794 [Fonticula alba]|uniref:Uncharacterized protein n=1 Tax=Fonticula alba TaxID=691883 RepID=A0A058Z4T7_FONAL|nr:hypothetical protein H696_04794 [Fonticula alba]KCV68502.1 hypothetical protein H696_04794 [Fonticula alba]|eukprot:XP_009496934.1 hypothetical protein H696_04794 [Fonticula alba]
MNSPILDQLIRWAARRSPVALDAAAGDVSLDYDRLAGEEPEPRPSGTRPPPTIKGNGGANDGMFTGSDAQLAAILLGILGFFMVLSIVILVVIFIKARQRRVVLNRHFHMDETVAERRLRDGYADMDATAGPGSTLAALAIGPTSGRPAGGGPVGSNAARIDFLLSQVSQSRRGSAASGHGVEKACPDAPAGSTTIDLTEAILRYHQRLVMQQRLHRDVGDTLPDLGNIVVAPPMREFAGGAGGAPLVFNATRPEAAALQQRVQECPQSF